MIDEGLSHVHAGELEDGISAVRPRIGAMLHDADQRRAATLAALNVDGEILDLLESVAGVLATTHQWILEQPAEHAEDFVIRIHSDFEDAVDGILTHKMSAVMDPCRDLMEIGVLFREFRSVPTALQRWVESEVQQLGEFSFGKLVWKGNRDPVILFSSIAEAQEEYTAHSRTLHAQAPLIARGELNREHVSPPAERMITWAQLMTTEIVRHVASSLTELTMWHAVRMVEVTDYDLDSEDWERIRAWLSRERSALRFRMPDDLREEWASRYRRKGKR